MTLSSLIKFLSESTVDDSEVGNADELFKKAHKDRVRKEISAASNIYKDEDADDYNEDTTANISVIKNRIQSTRARMLELKRELAQEKKTRDILTKRLHANLAPVKEIFKKRAIVTPEKEKHTSNVKLILNNIKSDKHNKALDAFFTSEGLRVQNIKINKHHSWSKHLFEIDINTNLIKASTTYSRIIGEINDQALTKKEAKVDFIESNLQGLTTMLPKILSKILELQDLNITVNHTVKYNTLTNIEVIFHIAVDR